MPIIDDATRPILILKYLEEKNLNIHDLREKMDKYDDDVSGRRTQRSIKNLIEAEIIEVKGNGEYYILETPSKYKLISGVMKEYFETPYFRTKIPGEIVTRIIAENIENIKKPVNYMMKFKDALENSQMISFYYTPQHFETCERVRQAGYLFAPGTPSGKIPVRTLPRFLVFSKKRMLLLGETNLGKSARLYRYELKGMGAFEIHEAAFPTIKIRAEESYENSIKVWEDGESYDITISQINAADQTSPIIHALKVNGEEEILSCMAASRGTLKIVNPPEGIRNKAQELNLGDHYFLFN